MRLPAENFGISPQRQNGFGPFFAHANVLRQTGKDVNLFLNRFLKNFLDIPLGGKISFFFLTCIPLKANLKSL